ncbi:Uncharacterised protein [uncultured archaeon]|nr:Uncharacterised protein [uncultured archaeon]
MNMNLNVGDVAECKLNERTYIVKVSECFIPSWFSGVILEEKPSDEMDDVGLEGRFPKECIKKYHQRSNDSRRRLSVVESIS